MIIVEMIRYLKTLELKYGPETKIYFDCPDCKVAFTPESVEIQHLHISSKVK